MPVIAIVMLCDEQQAMQGSMQKNVQVYIELNIISYILRDGHTSKLPSQSSFSHLQSASVKSINNYVASVPIFRSYLLV